MNGKKNRDGVKSFICLKVLIISILILFVFEVCILIIYILSIEESFVKCINLYLYYTILKARKFLEILIGPFVLY